MSTIAYSRPGRRPEADGVAPELVFLHIPKTAGTSQRGTFRRCYGPENVFWFGDDCPGEIDHYPSDLIGDSIVVGGHKPLSFYPRDIDPLYCAVIRDPVERAVSLFAYYTQPELAREERGRLARERNLARLLQQGIDPDSMVRSIKHCRAFRKQISNVQCAYISSSKARFRAALDSLFQHDFVVGTMVDYRRFHDYLGELLGWPTALPRTENRSQHDYARRYLEDSELVALVREINLEDYKLLEYVEREHEGLYVNLRDAERRRQRFGRLPLNPVKSIRLADWEETAEKLWPRRNDASWVQWPLNKLMLAKPARLLYMSIPGPANPGVNQLMLDCARLEHASTLRNLGLMRVTSKFKTGLMLADYDRAFSRNVRRGDGYFKFAVINEPVSRLVNVYVANFVARRAGIPGDMYRAYLHRMMADIQGGGKLDLERGVSFREFVAAILRNQPKSQHVLWIPQFLHLKGVDHYDKLYREDQLELIVVDLARRSGLDLHLPASLRGRTMIPGSAGAGVVSSGDFADTPAGKLPGDQEIWRSNLVDEALYTMIKAYYDEDCRLYDSIATDNAGEKPA